MANLLRFLSDVVLCQFLIPEDYVNRKHCGRFDTSSSKWPRLDRQRVALGRQKRESTFILWNQRKEALGLHRLTNSEFAEMLLHQQVADVDWTGRGSRGELSWRKQRKSFNARSKEESK